MKFITSFYYDDQEQAVWFTDGYFDHTGVLTITGHTVASFKDKMVREKLIALGWTPPQIEGVFVYG